MCNAESIISTATPPTCVKCGTILDYYTPMNTVIATIPITIVCAAACPTNAVYFVDAFNIRTCHW